jgi:hypothetical protein
VLNWDDEIVALTGAETHAFRRAGYKVTGNTYLDYMRKVLSSGLAGPNDIWRALDSYLLSVGIRQRRCRLVALLRAKLLRRWSGERWIRASSHLTGAATCARPAGETSSAAVLAKRVTLLGAPPQIA